MLEHAAQNPRSCLLLACLRATARVHGEVSRRDEGRGELKPILEESARRKKTRDKIKMKIHSSCEIEHFVETHLCNLCDTPIARITGCVSSLMI